MAFIHPADGYDEPIHVHVTKGGANGKIWLEPTVDIAYMRGFSNSEQKDILDAIQANSGKFKTKWNEYFGK